MPYTKTVCFNSILVLKLIYTLVYFKRWENSNVHMYMILSRIKNLLSNALLPCYIHMSKYQHDFMYANNV